MLFQLLFNTLLWRQIKNHVLFGLPPPITAWNPFTGAENPLPPNNLISSLTTAEGTQLPAFVHFAIANLQKAVAANIAANLSTTKKTQYCSFENYFCSPAVYPFVKPSTCKLVSNAQLQPDTRWTPEKWSIASNRSGKRSKSRKFIAATNCIFGNNCADRESAQSSCKCSTKPQPY